MLLGPDPGFRLFQPGRVPQGADDDLPWPDAYRPSAPTSPLGVQRFTFGRMDLIDGHLVSDAGHGHIRPLRGGHDGSAAHPCNSRNRQSACIRPSLA